MAFNYSVQLNDPTNSGGSSDAVLVYDLQQALSVWSDYISGLGTLIVNLTIANTSEGREAGGPTSAFMVGPNIYEASSEYELTTGRHVSGTTSDITITIDPGYLSYLDLAAGLAYNSIVPNNEYNPIVVFLHELMHGFGQTGYYSQSGILTGGTESNFDTLIHKTSSGAFFTGSNAEAAYGGPVPLTTNSTAGENYYHFGNNQSDIGRTPPTVLDPLTDDLMNGIVLFFNHQYPISNLDLGVLKDLGYQIVAPPLNKVERFFDTATGDHFYTPSVAESVHVRETLPTYHDEGAPWSTPSPGSLTTMCSAFLIVPLAIIFIQVASPNVTT